MTRHLLFLLPAVMLAAGCSPNVTVPDSGLPGAKAPPVEYRSALEGYQAFAGDKLVPWREANDAVKESGER